MISGGVIIFPVW